MQVARIAARAAAVPASEVRAAVAGAVVRPVPDAVAEALATDERRLAVRSWLRRLASLGATSMPALSAALAEVVGGPLPPVRKDEVWRETAAGLVARLDSVWN